MASIQNTTENKEIERLQFFSEQRLYESDFQAIEAVNREMRWRHNQNLHQPGIGDGFAVTGEIGDREVTIKPGYAIDSKGREIVLTKAKDLPVPAVAGDKNNKPIFYYLTVSYPEEIDLEEVETRKGVCTSRGTIRLREEPSFCWIELDSDDKQPKSSSLKEDIKNGLKIIVVQTEIQNCKLNEKISIAHRQNARPAKGSNIVSGRYFPEKNEWQVWSNGSKKLGLKIKVDTSCAKFTIPPNYYAEIVGQRFVDNSIDTTLGSLNPPYMLEGFTNLIIPEQQNKLITTCFKMYILMPFMCAGSTSIGTIIECTDGIKINPPEFLKNDDQINQILSKLGWYIEWRGIEESRKID